MIEIKKATASSIEILSVLGRVTYSESHGQYIEDAHDLRMYTNEAFSILKTKKDLNNPENLFYIIYVNELPVGYAKLILNAKTESVSSQKGCRLERIYILQDFLHLKIGKPFFTFLVEKAKELEMDTMWLTVYFKNVRAIKFYQKNDFSCVGEVNFLVNGSEYVTKVFSKSI